MRSHEAIWLYVGLSPARENLESASPWHRPVCSEAARAMVEVGLPSFARLPEEWVERCSHPIELPSARTNSASRNFWPSCA